MVLLVSMSVNSLYSGVKKFYRGVKFLYNIVLGLLIIIS